VELDGDLLVGAAAGKMVEDLELAKFVMIAAWLTHSAARRSSTAKFRPDNPGASCRLLHDCYNLDTQATKGSRVASRPKAAVVVGPSSGNQRRRCSTGQAADANRHRADADRRSDGR